MSHSISHDSGTNSSRFVWLSVLICICVLMAVTVSAPEDFKADRYGTESILPPIMLKSLKAAGRVTAMLLVAYNLYFIWQNPRRWKSAKLLLPIIGFALFAICSTLWSASRTTTLSQAITFGTLVALAVLISTIWKDEKDTSLLLKCCSLTLVLISSALIVLHFVNPDLGALTRSSSGLFHSTNACASASLGIVILFASRMIWGWSWTRQLLVPAMTVHLMTMFIGANRLSLVIMVLICTIVLVSLANKALVAASILTIVIASLTYVCFDPGMTLLDGLSEKIGVISAQGQTRAQLTELSGRAEMWSKIWDSFLESPLVGHGYFVTSDSGRLYVWGEWGNWTAHNFLLQLLSTMGVIGALLLLAGIANVGLRVIGKMGTADEAAGRLAIFLLTLTAWFVAWGLLNESILGPLQPESVIFAIVLGLGSALAITTFSPSGTLPDSDAVEESLGSRLQ